MTVLSQDLNRERRFTAFLKGNIFPQLQAEGITVDVNTDVELDRQGVDALVGGAFVDIKAHRLRRGEISRRHAFERLTRNRIGDGINEVTGVVDGWLVSKNKVTEKYLLCDYETDESGAILSVTVVLVDRTKLISFLRDERGIDIEGDTHAFMRNVCSAAPQENGSLKFYFKNVYDVSLTHSAQLPEQPLNIVISHSTLVQLCDWCKIFKMSEPVTW